MSLKSAIREAALALQHTVNLGEEVVVKPVKASATYIVTVTEPNENSTPKETPVKDAFLNLLFVGAKVGITYANEKVNKLQK